jgi:lysophospholipase
MLEINTGAYPTAIAASLAYGGCSRGSDASYAPGQHDFDFDQTFADEDGTHSQARFDMKMAIYRAHRELPIGGVSYRWICEATTATARMRTLGRRSAVPTLIFQGGADVTVKPEGQIRYCSEAARCQMIRFTGARHEILMETDSLRNAALAYTVRYFNAFASGSVLR